MGCGMKCAKAFLIAFNLIFALVGAALLGVGIFLLVDNGTVMNVLGNVNLSAEVTSAISSAISQVSLLKAGAYILIGVGAFLFIIGFAGCCGAIRESKCLLIIYCIIVGLILVVQITGGVLAYVFKDQASLYLRNYLNGTIADKYVGTAYQNGLVKATDVYSLAWDVAHASLSCCGNYNASDFSNYATLWNNNYTITTSGVAYSFTPQVPVTCCKMKDITKFPDDLTNIQFVNITACLMSADPAATNTIGCYDQILGKISTYSYAALGVAAGVAVIELLGIIAACVVMKKVADDK